MKTNLIIPIIISLIVISCDSGVRMVSEDTEEHENDGVVFLSEKQRNILGLQYGNLQMRNLTTVVKINGQLEVPPASSADVTAVIGGNVKEIRVFHGDKVEKGQPLAILEHPDYIRLQEEFAEVANNLEFLKQEYERQKELFENEVAAGRDYQKVKADYNTVIARYAGLQSRLKLLNLQPDRVLAGKISESIIIIAPISGYVKEINIKLGTFVEAKDKLFSIIDIKDIHADFLVYEKDVHLVEEGQKIHFTVSNRPGDELTAEIFAVGKEFESNTRAVHIHAKLINNPGGLIPGMYVTGHLHTDANYALALPEDAIVKKGLKSYIFATYPKIGGEKEGRIGSQTGTSDKSEKAYKMIEIVTGLTDGGYSQVSLLDSLPEDSQIVMNAAYYLLAEMNKGETGEGH